MATVSNEELYIRYGEIKMDNNITQMENAKISIKNDFDSMKTALEDIHQLVLARPFEDEHLLFAIATICDNQLHGENSNDE